MSSHQATLLLPGGGHTADASMATLATRRSRLGFIATSDRPDQPSLFDFDAVCLAPELAEDPGVFESCLLQVMKKSVSIWFFSAATRMWRGPPNVQCLEDANGKLFIHEFKARFTGGMAGRQMPGADEAGSAIRAFNCIELAGALKHEGTPRESFETMQARPVDGCKANLFARSGTWFQRVSASHGPGLDTSND